MVRMYSSIQSFRGPRMAVAAPRLAILLTSPSLESRSIYKLLIVGFYLAYLRRRCRRMVRMYCSTRSVQTFRGLRVVAIAAPRPVILLTLPGLESRSIYKSFINQLDLDHAEARAMATQNSPVLKS